MRNYYKIKVFVEKEEYDYEGDCYHTTEPANEETYIVDVTEIKNISADENAILNHAKKIAKEQYEKYWAERDLYFDEDCTINSEFLYEFDSEHPENVATFEIKQLTEEEKEVLRNPPRNCWKKKNWNNVFEKIVRKAQNIRNDNKKDWQEYLRDDMLFSEDKIKDEILIRELKITVSELRKELFKLDMKNKSLEFFLQNIKIEAGRAIGQNN